MLRKIDWLNISRVSGVFTAPRAGVYLVTFSYESRNDHNQATSVYVHLNGERLQETHHSTDYSSGGRGQVRTTGGRAVYQRLGAGDTLTLQTGTVTGGMYNIVFCVELNN